MSMKTRWKLIFAFSRMFVWNFKMAYGQHAKRDSFDSFQQVLVGAPNDGKGNNILIQKRFHSSFFFKSEHGYEENNSHNASARDTPLAQPKQTLARTHTHTKGQVQKGKKTLVNLLLKHKARSRGKRGVRRKTCVNVHTHTQSLEFWLTKVLT